MRHHLRVGIDLDGVGYPFIEILRRWLVEVRGREPEELPAAQEWDFYGAWNLTPDAFHQEFHDAVAAGFMFAVGEPAPGFIDLLETVVANGDEVHIVTSRNVGSPAVAAMARRSTLAWVARLEAPIHSVTVSADKGCVETDVFLEDSPMNYDALDDVGETVPFLLDRPWNAGHPGRRVKTFPAFLLEAEHLRHELASAGPDGAALCCRCGQWWSGEIMELGAGGGLGVCLP